MTQFWIYVVLLLLAALFVLLWPILRGRKDQTEEDRTALNVALYEEHIAELEEQHASGTLTDAELEEGRLEADRELLDDTDAGRPKQVANLGNALPLIAALLVPIAGLGLYMHWGASDKVALTAGLADQPQTVEEMIQRLEDTVRVQPDSVDAWYFLARAYMGQQRPKESALAYEKTVELAGRQPDLLGQWAQALYFAGDSQWTANIQGLVDEALKIDPKEPTTLGLVGMDAFENQRFQDAIDAWEQLLTGLDPQDPSYDVIQTGIERARNNLQHTAQPEVSSRAETPAPATEVVEPADTGNYQLLINVSISDELAAQVAKTDTVYVFARPEAGSPVPLAAKRLTVADLPAQVALTDADSLLPELMLSDIANLKLQASISSSGDAMQTQWVSETVLIDATEDVEHALLIDQKN